MNWIKCEDRLPEPGTEVLVWIDGHRGPSWRNNYALVAYLTQNGSWTEERHPSHILVGVVMWAEIEIPEQS